MIFRKEPQRGGNKIAQGGTLGKAETENPQALKGRNKLFAVECNQYSTASGSELVSSPRRPTRYRSSYCTAAASQSATT